ncbi:hypothetical protein SAMN05519103_01369 [Rhizobiales bacterium GAS113]|jgi:hypothetical protein|nr:hypothetical protein SAMN05519103_01369 [Rhizobiales bacterium GAS113]
MIAARARRLGVASTLTCMARLSLLAILAAFVARPPSAVAQDVSLVGSWQSCETANHCSLRMAFLPNGRVIKQYIVLGATVTAYGRYRMNGHMLEVMWMRFAPKRVCPSGGDKSSTGQNCVETAEPDAQGDVAFNGFNALVWSTPGRPSLRLVRREQ